MSYSFNIDKIKDEENIIEKYSKKLNIDSKKIDEISKIRYNENYDIKDLIEASNKAYLDVYDNFDIKDKIEFIEYAFNNFDKDDKFKRTLYDNIYGTFYERYISIKDNYNNGINLDRDDISYLRLIARIFINAKLLEIEYKEDSKSDMNRFINQKLDELKKM